MKVKLNVVESYRVDTQSEADAAIEEARSEAMTKGYDVTGNKMSYKAKKSKGQVVDEGWEVTITKHVNDFGQDGAF